jgi:glycosyltransferase involved in cell wall biosynthesis
MSGVLHFIVPAGVDDARHPSGGNRYDRKLSDELTRRGWTVVEHRHAAGGADPLNAMPDDALVLADALVALQTPDAFVAHARRLRLVVLSHMAFGGEREAALLGAARAVVVTSEAAREALVARHQLDADAVRVAAPGVDQGELAAPTDHGGRLLCVGVVAPHKGQDALVAALARIRDRVWDCALVGAVDRDPVFAARVRRRITRAKLRSRVSLTGPLSPDQLDTAYQGADLLVSASHSESYGMAVAEALSHGVPVLCTDVGGVAEVIGGAVDGRRPGFLVPAGDPEALAGALREWLDDAALRAELRAAARRRRRTLPGWSETAEAVARTLNQTAAATEIPA